MSKAEQQSRAALSLDLKGVRCRLPRAEQASASQLPKHPLGIGFWLPVDNACIDARASHLDL